MAVAIRGTQASACPDTSERTGNPMVAAKIIEGVNPTRFASAAALRAILNRYVKPYPILQRALEQAPITRSGAEGMAGQKA